MTTVTKSLGGGCYLYEREGDKFEVNEQDHYLIKRGLARIEWETPEVVFTAPHKINDLLEVKRSRQSAEKWDRARTNSLVEGGE